VTTADHKLIRQLTRYPAIAAGCYAALVLICVLVTFSAFADLYDRYDALAAATAMLERIEGRNHSVGQVSSSGSDAPAGSPFLEGPSVAVAGAGLEQRVTGSIVKTGGNVLSTQIDLNSADAKKGFISLIVSCEVKQPALQQVLYDLEAGMPFLFIDQLEVQAPQANGEGSGPMRLMMTVSGEWRGKQ
jgi:general secretion pathway protein M